MLSRPRLALCVFFALPALAASPPTVADDDLALAFGDRESISLATGHRQNVRQAPAVATVITAEEIAAIGATDLDEVLETVPGLHVGRNPNSYGPRYLIRGMSSTYNGEVLMLVNGAPMTSIFAGDRGNTWFGLPVDNIARIEVVRGPGSALYGAEAMAGVINIITRRADDGAGTRLGARAGSFASRDAYALHGGRWGDIDVAAYLRRGVSDGQRRTIAADQQSAFDALTGGHASRAPGPVNVGYRATDAEVDLGHGHWRFNAALKKRDDLGTGVGVASALDPVGRSHNERHTAELGYTHPDFADNLGLKLTLGYFRWHEASDLVLFPPGGFFGGFPDGMIGNPDKWERHGRAALTVDYRALPGHHPRLGAGYEKQSIYRVRESKNFNPDFTPIGQVVDVSDTVPFMRPHDRYLRYVFVQDEWTMRPDWTLTAGVRHDRYSDFGDTSNPRLALVWDAAYNVTAKLLYGQAFRAPTFVESFAINNPVSLGNRDLKPERGETGEFALLWKISPTLNGAANLFHYRRRDVIEYVTQANGTAITRNVGRIDGEGGEIEVGWQATPTLRLAGNAAYQRAIDQTTGADTGYAPRRHLYARLDWAFAAGWQGGAQANRVADRRRSAGDARPPTPDYSAVDLTVRSKQPRFNVAVSIRNVFAADVREPAPAAIPQDLPMPGRNAWLELSYRL